MALLASLEIEPSPAMPAEAETISADVKEEEQNKQELLREYLAVHPETAAKSIPSLSLSV